MNEQLKFFELDEKATLDDVKRKYRELCKRYHPDASNANTAALFIKLTNYYEWLLNNHKPVIPVVSKKKPILNKDATVYYRVLSKHVNDVKINSDGFTIYLPEKVLRQKTIIYCINGLEEFRITLDAGTELPTKGTITNLKGSAVVNIAPDKGIWST